MVVNPHREYPVKAALRPWICGQTNLTGVRQPPIDAPREAIYTELTNTLRHFVIQRNVIYQKTARGSEAIATRQHGLSPRLRTILIMVDGKRQYADLEKLGQAETETLLGQLLDQGFIEAGAAAPPAAPIRTPVATTAPQMQSGVPGVTLKEARRYAVRRLTDILGPNADDLCIRIEAAQDLHAYQLAIARAEGTLRQYVSGNVASQFMADVNARMPQS